MAKKSNNILNNNYIGIDKRSELTGIFNPKNIYLNYVNNARYVEFDFTNLVYTLPINISRKSDGSYLDGSGWIVRNSNDLRITHSYTGYTYGLLIEEQRTNIYTFSEDFNGKFTSASFVGWTANVGATLNSTIDGLTGLENLLNADRAVPVTTYADKDNNQGTSVASTQRPCLSLYAKAAELTKLYFGDVNGGRFQLRVGVTAGDLIFLSLTPNFGPQQYFIEQNKDNWFRIGINNNRDNGQVAWQIMPYPDGATVFSNFRPTFGNCAGFGMYFWGAQIEAADPGRLYSTSYIRTTASTATRLQDEITISATGSNNVSWLKEPGSFYVEYYRRDGAGSSAHTIISTDNVTQRFICLEQIPSGNTLTLRWGTSSLSLTGGVTGLNKAAFTFTGSSGSSVQFALNGRISGTTTTNLIPSNIQWLTLGAKSTAVNSGFSDYFNSIISKVRYYPRQLTSSELQEITKNA